MPIFINHPGKGDDDDVLIILSGVAKKYPAGDDDDVTIILSDLELKYPDGGGDDDPDKLLLQKVHLRLVTLEWVS